MAERHVLMTRSAFVALAALLLSGCSLVAPPPSSPTASEPVVQGPSGDVAPPAPAELFLNPAAQQFLADARNWVNTGNTARAAISMERAIRIAPDHPEPWLALARLRFDEGDIGQAENLALKARNLSPRDSRFFTTAEAMLVEIQKTPL